MEKIGLFTPIKINKLDLPNRIMLSPAFSNSATPDGYVTKNTLEHYQNRARSGVGLVMVEHTSVNSYYLHPGNRLQISKDKHIQGLAQLVKIMHDEGCKVGLQIAHSIHGVGLKPEDLSLGTCYDIIEDFVDGARRAKQAGFDVIELHFAHTYTLADFLSRRTNKRTDEFGGDIYGRMRIHLEILKRIRQLVGPDFPLFARFSAEEFILEGNTLKQTRIFAQELEKNGIDCLDVSAGVRFDDGGLKGYSDVRGKPTIEYPDGPNVYLAEDIKKYVKVPVITVGKLGNPEFAESVIQQGRADMVALARPLIADAMWSDKVKNKRYDLIKECLYCNECLYERWNPEAHVHCMRYTCQNACPANIDVPVYIDLIAQGKYKEAYDVIQLENPFPLICGRVCDHPCETMCNRNKIDEPVAIRQLKRFASDQVLKMDGKFPVPEVAKDNGKKIAVIGSGPSGLSCAFFLKKKGYHVTVFEALPVPGGMLAKGLPGYRMPKELLEKEIDIWRAMGVEIVTNTQVGVDIPMSELKNKYDAVYIAVGTQQNRKIGIKGEDLQGVLGGVELLQKVNLGNNINFKDKKVVVIGGGNVAIDAARSLVRLGTRQVDLYCLEKRAEMPAHEWEVEDAEQEGVLIHNSWGPKEIVGVNGQVSEIVFKGCKSVFDKEGRFNPKYDEIRLLKVEADYIIAAIGQSVDNTFNNAGQKINIRGNSFVDVTHTCVTNVPGVFAGGDCVSGPDSVVGAIKYGKDAAKAIDIYLGGDGQIISKKNITRQMSGPIIEEKCDRQVMPYVSMEQRKNSFTEVESGFSEQMAKREAHRCLRCDVLKCSEL